MTGGGFEDPDSESSRAAEVADARARAATPPTSSSSTRSDDLTVDDPAYQTAVHRRLGRAARTTSSTRRRPSGAPGRRSWSATDRHVDLRRPAARRRRRRAQAGLERDRGRPARPRPARPRSAAAPSINRDINDQVSADIARAESISLPILRRPAGRSSSAASPRPACRWRSASPRSSARSPRCAAFALFTDVSIFAVNIVTIIGLGLAIDYGLFMVSRFREEIRRQPDVEDGAGPHDGHRRPHGGGLRRSPSRSRWPGC